LERQEKEKQSSRQQSQLVLEVGKKRLDPGWMGSWMIVGWMIAGQGHCQSAMARQRLFVIGRCVESCLAKKQRILCLLSFLRDTPQKSS